jgi:2-keto-4-pentenoate hydratase
MKKGAAFVCTLGLCHSVLVSGPTPAKSPPAGEAAAATIKLGSAYAAQKALVAQRLARDRASGYKAGFSLPAVHRALGLEAPAIGVLFEGGSVPPSTSVEVNSARALVIEAEIGFTIGQRIDRPVTDLAELRNLVSHVQPVIELPEMDAMRGPMTGHELIAKNIGSERYIKGTPRDKNMPFGAASSPRLYLDGKLVAEANPDMVAQDPWQTLRFMINTSLDIYGPVEAGQLFIAGSLIQFPHKQAGSYRVDFGRLGEIHFETR